MRVSMFLPRFHDAIRAGTKRQTIRKPRKNPVRVGEVIALRGWGGRPYGKGTKQFDIVPPVVVTAVSPVLLEFDFFPGSDAPMAVTLRGGVLAGDRAEAFARADGFADSADMAEHFRQKGVDSFEGTLIQWESPK